MVSVNTNAAAITALRTLQQTNATLDKTQNRISTGLKIGEAKDNAAYWAISTTLKSDNKSLGTVKDALGLGGSTVDVAYQGLNKAKDVLDEIKSKLTAATQDGVNRDTIQNEIKQLQDQLKSIATSSIFSGENWLAVDTSVAGFNPEKQVVASFSRDQNGSVTIGTIKVQTATVALFDASTALNSGGIIDGAMNLKGKDGRDLTIGGTDVTTGNASVAGLTATAATGVAGGAATPTAATTLGGAGAKALVSTGNLTLSEYAPGDRITIKLNVNGTTTTITTAALAPAGASLALTDVASALDTALTGIANVAVNGTALDIEADAIGAKTVFSLAQFTLRDANGKVKTATNTPAATAANYETGSFTSVTLDKDDGLYFRVQADDATAATNVAINRDLIDKALANVSGHVSGKIDNAAQFKTVLDAALAAANIKNVNTKVTSTDKITFSTDSVGTDSKLIVSDLQASQGGDTISVETIDISTSAAAFAGKTSTEIKQILSAYIDVVNTAINKVTSAAGLLGSVASRIDMQKGFVDTLMDTIDKGVGNLIDADMSEESTRLQALQVKQQLGVQALSIANQSSQNILSLFQSSR